MRKKFNIFCDGMRNREGSNHGLQRIWKSYKSTVLAETVSNDRQSGNDRPGSDDGRLNK